MTLQSLVFRAHFNFLFWFCLLIMIEVNAQPSSSYPAYWINLSGVVSNGSVLIKNSGPNTWGGGAISSNILEPNINGWIEFTGVSGAHYIVGLASDNKIDSDKFSHGFFLDQGANYFAVYEGATIIVLGGWQVGDVFRIAREGNAVNYYRNGVVVRTVSVNPAVLLHIKAAIRYAGKSTSSINSSFDGRLIVEGSVTATDEGTGAGNISVSTSGRAGPYSYSWSSGEQTSSIISKPVGNYTVTITDATGHVQQRTYSVGYKLNWINTTGVSVSGSVLSKTASISTWGNGGITSNMLSPYEDGWLEFSAGKNYHYLIGFAVNDILDTDKFNHAFLIDYDNNRFRIHEGTSVTGYLPWQTGDVFRIAREGNTVIYYRNGTVIKTVTVNPNLVLKVKSALQYQGKSTPYVNTSVEGKLFLKGTVTGLAGNSGSGSIMFDANGTSGPYNYTWSSGEQTASINYKQRGSYTVTVTDGIGRTKARTYNVGYKVNWINQVGVSINGGILTKTVIGSVWDNAGAVSSNVLAANTDGWIEFSTLSGDYMVGLASNNTIDLDEFTNAIRVDHLTNTYVLYSGFSGVGSGIWQIGDVFRISREGSEIHYYKNDEVIKSLSVNPALVLKVKASIRYRSERTPIINASFWSSDGVIRTYYAIAIGVWTTPSIWSLEENGSPSAVYPDDIDRVIIKGHEVTVNSNVKCAGISIISDNDNTCLKVEGNAGQLTVKGNVMIQQDNNSNTSEVLRVQNNGILDVTN